jgi:diaminohydroxyphosphoribosylaminopyrimidine deaminase/5-amino-6-(5-phosphoribosylamino)uracil reductase
MAQAEFTYSDENIIRRAMSLAESVRCITSPNPWVGAVVVTDDGEMFDGTTGEPGQAHAEIEAIRAAGDKARGATLYVTLEPCCHVGRTGPCTDTIIEAGVKRVIIGIIDPDKKVRGASIDILRKAGITVDVGLCENEIRQQLAPYIKHRETGLAWVIVKLASTLDGKIAATDGSSQWITGDEARADAHRLRAESDVIIVGAHTYKHDHPQLNVRDYSPPRMPQQGSLDPRKIVLGHAEDDVETMSGDVKEILAELGKQGVLQVMVEGGAATAGEFHRAGVVDQYVFYIAPAILGDGINMFSSNETSMKDIWRAKGARVTQLGNDFRVELDTFDVSNDERFVRKVSQAQLPTEWGDFTCHVFESNDGEQHVVLVMGDVNEQTDVLVRVHSECLTGDTFKSKRCDCGQQLDAAMKYIAEHGQGILVYMRGHEGRGIGIGHKINAYALQDKGLDTVDANVALGLPIDSRNYEIAGHILNELGVKTMRLITNNPNKYSGLEEIGPDILDRIGLPVTTNSYNENYLKTKRDRLGHMMDWLEN